LLNRDYICIEINEDYFNVANERLKQEGLSQYVSDKEDDKTGGKQ